MFQNLTGWHALIVLAVVLLLFGATKLPALARSVGQSVRILKDEVVERPADAEQSASGTDSAAAAGRAAETAETETHAVAASSRAGS
ncbi:MAG: twin-arginine translocase TatA/TatE family subunit [Protaetiibacter sp.]